MADPSQDLLIAAGMTPLQRYRFLTSVIVPRPIGWLSTRSAAGVDNLAPYSFFNGIAANPMLVVAGIGSRQDGAKDTLVNIRENPAFCCNMVTEKHLQAMNLSAGDYPAGVSEFDALDIPKAEAAEVNAPYVADCPVVLECELFKEVDLEGASTSMVVGKVMAVRLGAETRELWHNDFLDVGSFRPVGRLWAGNYAFVDDIFRLERPKIDRATGEVVEPPS
ncbi:MAG: flavin reductase family protein [Acidobacteriota bacterium]|jgi:flavin reductase (DIM6/NTAB) family NADH-FMN oxidoreductase RutF